MLSTRADPKSYRGNLRLISRDASLAQALWPRLRTHVPRVVVDREGDRWEAKNLNECWRLAKYFPGDRFARHTDAFFERSRDERSFFTVNVYLNDVPAEHGGATRFYVSGGRTRHGLHRVRIKL